MVARAQAAARDDGTVTGLEIVRRTRVEGHFGF